MAKKKTKPKHSKQSTVAKQASITDSINDEVIAAALSSVNQPVLMKVCRLCETKDGPFLNIFDAEKVTAKKIEELMPFWIAENDDLPHKICFRCSAKVEELYEFIQKCIKTQNNLRTAIGKKEPLAIKTKTRTMWEEKLNKTNMTNDDICDALIKKAMEGIKDIPLNPLPLEDENPPSSSPLTSVAKKLKSESSNIVPKKEKHIKNNGDDPDITLKQLKLSIEKIDQKSPVTRNSRANNSEALLERLGTATTKKSINKQSTFENNKKLLNKVQEGSIENRTSLSVETKEKSNLKVGHNEENSVNKSSTSAEIKEKSKPIEMIDDEDSSDSVKNKHSKTLDQKVQVNSKAGFNIMDHVSTIKVNGVGILFQCKLCNRNFLKKEVVITHGCAKNSVPKVEFTKHIPPPEPPKASTVKYIKIDDEFKKTLSIEYSKRDTDKKTESEMFNKPSVSEIKPKPKIGPASRVKREPNVSEPQTLPEKEPSPPPSSEKQPNTVPNTLLPSVHFPSMPSLNSRYKLVPGPNNTFTLVEDSSVNENKVVEENSSRTNVDKKRKVSDDFKKAAETKPKDRKENNFVTVPSPEVIDLEELRPSQPIAAEQPYPVGLFQTVPHHSSIYVPPVAPQPQVFTTPAMKKQSYTIVQTGNPSKLLISAKPQTQPPVEEVPRKRPRKVKPEVKDVGKEPFTVTLEDNAPPKDAGFFTFINVDPLLQPSYVLPTHNIIQESQISTSTPIVRDGSDNKDKEKYNCNMCGEKFSREKKLLAHIQSHYSKMDEEDQLRAEKNAKKRSRKS